MTAPPGTAPCDGTFVALRDLKTRPVESRSLAETKTRSPKSAGSASARTQVAHGSSGFSRLGNGRSAGITGICPSEVAIQTWVISISRSRERFVTVKKRHGVSVPMNTASCISNPSRRRLRIASRMRSGIQARTPRKFRCSHLPHYVVQQGFRSLRMTPDADSRYASVTLPPTPSGGQGFVDGTRRSTGSTSSVNGTCGACTRPHRSGYPVDSKNLPQAAPLPPSLRGARRSLGARVSIDVCARPRRRPPFALSPDR